MENESNGTRKITSPFPLSETLAGFSLIALLDMFMLPKVKVKKWPAKLLYITWKDREQFEYATCLYVGSRFLPGVRGLADDWQGIEGSCLHHKHYRNMMERITNVYRWTNYQGSEPIDFCGISREYAEPEKNQIRVNHTLTRAARDPSRVVLMWLFRTPSG